MARNTECIAMLLAGGQGSRLGILTKNIAKPAVPYGGKYRIIDFPLSNCVNSGIYTVGVLTQYQPLELNKYIGLFIATIIKAERPKYNYGRKWKKEFMEKSIIKLPTKNGLPDWDFMENYIKSLPYSDRI